MRILNIFTLLLFALPLFSQVEPPPIYHEIKLNLENAEQFKQLAQLGVAVDHFHGTLETGLEIVVNEYELGIIQNAGFEIEVVQEDLAAFYEARNIKELKELI
jgi:hypothetical protein